MITQFFFIMNFMNKIIYTLLGSLVMLLLFYGMWKRDESDSYREKIYVLEGHLMESEHNRIAYLHLYSSVYQNYFNNQSSIREKVGSKSSVLVYRFSKNMCAGCVHEDLSEIEQFQKDIGKGKIVLLPAYPDDRMGMIELNNMLAVKFNYVNIPCKSFLIPSQDGDFQQRYFAVIDNEGNLTMVFFPRRDETKLTRLYFSEVKKLIIE